MTLRDKLFSAFNEQDRHMDGDGLVKMEDRADLALEVFREWLIAEANEALSDNKHNTYAALLNRASSLKEASE
jgi:hypothetical protein